MILATFIYIKVVQINDFCHSLVLKIEHSSNDYTPVLQLLNLNILASRRYTSNLRFLVKLLNEQIDSP